MNEFLLTLQKDWDIEPHGAVRGIGTEENSINSIHSENRYYL
jgi:hypothetical protein